MTTVGLSGRREGAGAEHPLLGTPRRDVLVAGAMAVATAAVFVLVARRQAFPWIGRLDRSFLAQMVAHRSGAVTTAAKILNVLGLVYVVLPVRLLIAAFLAWRRRWWHTAAFVSAMIVSEALIGPLKALYDLPRPPGALVATSGASFPSGHAVAASVTVVAAVIALFPEGRGRYGWGAAAVGFSLLMGLSRAYLAAHWLADAIAGILLGTSVALFTALAVDALRARVLARRRE